MMQTGWDRSAQAWIAGMGHTGDPARVYVMNAPMLAALPNAAEVPDIGCGAGRFCRMMQARPGKAPVYAMDNVMQERAQAVAWSGLRIVNYRRPLSAYMKAFLGAGRTLTTVNDPPYTGDDEGFAGRWQRMLWAFQMVWKRRRPPHDD